MSNSLEVLHYPHQPPWDVAFTRLSQHFLRQVELCVAVLMPKFIAVGLWTDMHVRQTPRGVSAFLAVASQRGLLFILDFTLVDGMNVARYPGATADVRLLEANGDVLAQYPPTASSPGQTYHASFEQVLAADGDCLHAGTVYTMASTYFDVTAKGGAQSDN